MTRVEKICETCAASFKVKPYRCTSARFCSRSCRAKWSAPLSLNKGPKPHLKGNRHAAGQKPNRTAFTGGNRPWNAGLKGIHLSRATEFKPGRPNFDQKPLGYVSVRQRKKDCGPRAYVKIAEPNRWRLRAVLVWEDANGRPEPKAEHLIEHLPELLAARCLMAFYGLSIA